jgi:hypothetical protein
VSAAAGRSSNARARRGDETAFLAFADTGAAEQFVTIAYSGGLARALTWSHVPVVDEETPMRIDSPIAALALVLPLAVAAPVSGASLEAEIANRGAYIETQTLAKAQAAVEQDLAAAPGGLLRREAERVVAAAPPLPVPAPARSEG